MTDHPGIVNKTRVGSNCYTHQFASADMLHHLTVDRPGCVRVMLELDRVWLQRQSGEAPPFPAELGEGAWAQAWQACADHDVHVIVTLLCKDGLAWRGDGQPSDPWWWHWFARWRLRYKGLQWASPNLTRGDQDGGQLWFARWDDWRRCLDGLAAIRDRYSVTMILDGWNEADLRPSAGVGNAENRHGEWGTSLLDATLFGFTGGLARYTDMIRETRAVFDSWTATGGVIWPAWREAAAAGGPHIQSLHIYGAQNATDQTARGSLTQQSTAWDELGVDGPVAVTEASMGQSAGGDGFDDQQAKDHREAIGRYQQLIGDRLTHYADHTAGPWPWEQTATHPQGFGRWWV